MKPLAQAEDRSLAIVKTSLIDRFGFRKVQWRAEALDLLGEVGEEDGFRYKRHGLIYERLADVVDTELIRERVCR